MADKVYWRDDFTVTIRLRGVDRHGDEVPAAVPPFDWTARLYTPGSRRFVAISQKDGEARGWTEADGGAIRVSLDRHGLWPGPLMAEFAFSLPDGGYADGNMRLERLYDLGVTLTADAGDIPGEAVAEAAVPWQLIKGDRGESAVVATAEIVTDADTYLLPVCGEPPSPKRAGGCGSGYYGSGYGGDGELWPLWGTWDIDALAGGAEIPPEGDEP